MIKACHTCDHSGNNNENGDLCPIVNMCHCNHLYIPAVKFLGRRVAVENFEKVKADWVNNCLEENAKSVSEAEIYVDLLLEEI